MADVSAKLTGDNSQFKAMLDDSLAKAQTFAGQIGGKVGGKLFEFRDVSTAIATALGINIQSIAESFARLVTGMTKETEELLKKFDAMAEKQVELSTKRMRLGDTEYDQLQRLERERAKLQDTITKGLQAETKEIATAVDEYGRVLATRKETVVTQMEHNRIKEAELKLEETLAAINEIKGKQKEKATTAEKENFRVRETNEAAMNKLLEEQNDKRRATLEPLARAQTIQSEMLGVEERIAELIAQGVDATGEINRLGVLRKQNEEALSDLYEDAWYLEEKQGDAAEETLATKKEELEVVKAIASVTRVGSGYDSQSIEALEGVRDRLRRQIQQINEREFGRGGGVGGKGKPAELYILESELFNLEKELNLRRQVGQFAGRFGEARARQEFGDTLTERAVNDLRDSNVRTANLLEEINKRLEKSGLFPKT